MTADSQTESRPFSLCYSLYFLLFHYAPLQPLLRILSVSAPPRLQEGALVVFLVPRPFSHPCILVINRFSDLLPVFLCLEVWLLEALDVLCANLGRI